MTDISKIKLANGTTVTLKDAQGRADLLTLLGGHDLAALGNAAWKALAASISDNDEGLANAKQVKAYVDSMIETIPEFDVVVVPAGEDLPTASEDTFHKIYLKSGGISGSYVEYITIRSGSTYTWEQVGSLDADFSAYVKKETKIAGIDLNDDITVAELQNALGLKALAYKDNATGSTTLNTIDSIAVDEVTVAGNATVTYTPTGADLTKGAFTPAGSVTLAADAAGTQISGSVSKPAIDVDDSTVDTFVKSLKAGEVDAASFTEGAFTANVPTALDLTKFNGGSKAADTFTQGSLPSLGTETKSAFATEGVVAAIGSGEDNETLIFTTAGTAQAVTAQGTFNAGALPTFTEGKFTAASLATGFYTPGTAASKASDSFSAKKLPVVDGTADAVTAVTATLHEAPTFTGDKFKATFTGTEQADVIVTGVTYDKADAAAAFSEKVTPTISAAGITRTPKTVQITVE